ncbi:MAG: thioredoxin domain-containing protein [Flavobacteriales bacterium]|nr:thioredoxin domain-containing protein [Flavobacteriales bacterium]
MKLNFFISILLLYLCSCLNSNDFDPNTIPVNVLDVENHQMLKLLEDNPGVLLDVRTPEEINKGFLTNASFINFYDENFLQKASWIKKNQPIYVYCHAGGRSSKAAEMLIKLGFREVYNLVGGFSKWVEDGYLVEKGLDNIKGPSSKSFTKKELDGILLKNQNVILVFKTPWCLPCKKLDAVLDSFSINSPNWVVVKINMDANKDLAENYQVKSVPTLLFFKESKKSSSHIGFINLEDLILESQK